MPTVLQIEAPGGEPIELDRECVVPRRLDETLRPLAGDRARAAVTKALQQPLEFPPIADSIVPGDTVAVALGEGIPDVASVASGMLDAIVQAGVEPARITLVAAAKSDAKRVRQAVDEAVAVVRHDPTDENELCYAGVTREDDVSLLLNRALFEADLTIPVSRASTPDDPANRGPYDGLYPAFFHIDSVRALRGSGDERPEWWRNRTNEAGWVIGAPLVVRVAPGEGDRVAGVYAGEPEAVEHESSQAARRAWVRIVEQDADLVIATVTGDPDRQTWDDVARALHAADRVAAPGAPVAICTALGQKIGKSLARLRGAGDMDQTLRRLAKDAHPDTHAARAIADALTRGPVFLMSRLGDDLVEDLGMAPIGGAAELQRLADRFDRVMLLEHAQHIEITDREEA
ncbi:hypothetical protein KOR34_39440 [Posidoniimonas corsicana]|uniref:LarA-like N-terminal domain-containing protein n=1 Tax=Posidoniimonas corsicana TaxID=1938618 RepID=A0A5C5V2I4_9BACT|nr:lactate racemase domain-containing protein [Posidoniimonas corsicana]TWT32183.1 hypothetical protein KOR34_39440 [Posidoniimonas corsicana]